MTEQEIEKIKQSYSIMSSGEALIIGTLCDELLETKKYLKHWADNYNELEPQYQEFKDLAYRRGNKLVEIETRIKEIEGILNR